MLERLVQPQAHFFEVDTDCSTLRITNMPVAKAMVIANRRAYGKSSGIKSNVREGCTTVMKRSKPYAMTRAVDSKAAGLDAKPAQRICLACCC